MKKKENEAINYRLIRDFRNLFDKKKEDCYKLVRNSINNNSFISSKDTGEECVMHLRSNDIEFMIYDNTDDGIE